jgi:hypothetical protein
MKPFENDRELAATLEALRPAPSPEFAAGLDERAAAGFPRSAHSGGSPHRALLAWLRGIAPRRALLPVGATAVALLAVATAVVATRPADHGSDTVATSNRPLPASVGSAGSGVNESFDGSGRYVEVEKGNPVPAAKAAPSSAAAEGSTSSGASEAESASEEVFENAAAPLPPVVKPAHRDVERGAELTLGAEPENVNDVAAKVFETVHAYDGIVLRSSVQGGSAGHAGATFALLIPSGKLSDALGALSGVADVRSRHESTLDITAPTVSASERLQDSNARIESLLGELGAAETESEREVAEIKLRGERHQAAELRAQLDQLQRRASMSRLQVQVVTGESSNGSSHGGGFGVGKALDDAGHALGIAAGVLIVTAAVLIPFALIALLIWVANRVWVKRRRESALG